MKNTTKRILSIICATMLLLGLAIVPASASTTDKLLVVSPASGSAPMDWFGIGNSSVTSATPTEYTASIKFKLSNYVGTTGRPLVINLGGNVGIGLSYVNNALNVYSTHTSDWGGSTAPTTSTLLTTTTLDQWLTISARAYLSNGVAKIDYDVNGTKTTLDSVRNTSAISTVTSNGNGSWYFLVDAGFTNSTGTGWSHVADWDLVIDSVGMSYTDAPEAVVLDEFTTITAAKGSTPTYPTDEGKTTFIRMNDPARMDVYTEDEPVEDLTDKWITIGKTTSTGWNALGLSNTNASSSTTVDEYTLDIRVKFDAKTITQSRPILFMSGDDKLGISVRSDGVYYYMTNSSDWGASYPPSNKLAAGIKVSDLLGVGKLNEWQDIQFKVYKSGTDVLCDMTINGTTTTGLNISTAATAPSPFYSHNANLGATYFTIDLGYPDGSVTNMIFDWVKLSYTGSADYLLNDFVDATVASAGAMPVQKNGNTWISLVTVDTAVTRDLEGLDYTVTLSGDANAYVQEASEATPHTAATDVTVSAMSPTMNVYAFAKAGYQVAGYKVDGGALNPIIANDDNLYTVPITKSCAVQFVTEPVGATTPVVAKKVADVAGDKVLVLSHRGTTSTGWANTGIATTEILSGEKFDSYILEYKFKYSNLVGNEATPDKPMFFNHGNNVFGTFPNDATGKLDFYLMPGAYETLTDDCVYLASSTVDAWNTVKLVVYKSGSSVLTDATVNGETKTGLTVKTAATVAPTPQITVDAGHGPYILQVTQVSGLGAVNPSQAYYRGYDVAFDYINLYAGDKEIEFDFNDVTLTAATDHATWAGGNTNSDNFAAFDEDVVADDSAAVDTALAAGYAAAVRDEFGGVSVIAKATNASEYGIIISPTVIETLTVADLANYYITNEESTSNIHAFTAYAQGTDGRFGVKVLGSEADATYFTNRTVYVYVYAVNGNAVDFAAVNTAGFLFN